MKPTEARVLLTGASGGIGQATARALRAAGAAVLLVGRSAERLEQQAQQLVQAGADTSRVRWAQADINRAGDRALLVREAQRLDCNVVIHNAGLPAFGRLGALDAEEIDAVLQTNLLAPMLLTQALLPRLQNLPAAQLVFVGSVLGSIGLPGFSVYSASKFGLHGFAQALRRELAGTKVRVQYIGPRSTDTGFNDPAVRHYNQATGTAQDTPDVVASEILRLLQDGTAERFLGFPEKLAVRLNALVPQWLDGSFRRHRDSLPTPTPTSIPNDITPLKGHAT
ncbi:MAG: SDR family oxidoreductase [Hydrogenophaga sp.]|uniref:SDR family oxidoreductase n=1 Tax=Hydrogenophaga sp. TaxID=1904254 RepID=UPI002730C408|nr:SDR family oxidoreductase [Hydrogenophaga sp.]MDP2164007.1 SDR family oxidoreductase [Hydrogenophaga sp.]MDP3475451.1 SDR family oxidoreductase [Hydrogenophaga sp.]